MEREYEFVPLWTGRCLTKMFFPHTDIWAAPVLTSLKGVSFDRDESVDGRLFISHFPVSTSKL